MSQEKVPVRGANRRGQRVIGGFAATCAFARSPSRSPSGRSGSAPSRMSRTSAPRAQVGSRPLVCCSARFLRCVRSGGSFNRAAQKATPDRALLGADALPEGVVAVLVRAVLLLECCISEVGPVRVAKLRGVLVVAPLRPNDWLPGGGVGRLGDRLGFERWSSGRVEAFREVDESRVVIDDKRYLVLPVLALAWRPIKRLVRSAKASVVSERPTRLIRGSIERSQACSTWRGGRVGRGSDGSRDDPRNAECRPSYRRTARQRPCCEPGKLVRSFPEICQTGTPPDPKFPRPSSICTNARTRGHAETQPLYRR
jgi:hypothetical protein